MGVKNGLIYYYPKYKYRRLELWNSSAHLIFNEILYGIMSGIVCLILLLLLLEVVVCSSAQEILAPQRVFFAVLVRYF